MRAMLDGVTQNSEAQVMADRDVNTAAARKEQHEITVEEDGVVEDGATNGVATGRQQSSDAETARRGSTSVPGERAESRTRRKFNLKKESENRGRSTAAGHEAAAPSTDSRPGAKSLDFKTFSFGLSKRWTDDFFWHSRYRDTEIEDQLEREDQLKVDVAIAFLKNVHRSAKDWDYVSRTVVPDPKEMEEFYHLNAGTYGEEEIQGFLTLDAIFLACFLMISLDVFPWLLGEVEYIFYAQPRGIFQVLSLRVFEPGNQIPLRLLRNAYRFLIRNTRVPNNVDKYQGLAKDNIDIADVKKYMGDCIEGADFILGAICTKYVESNGFPNLRGTRFWGGKVERQVMVRIKGKFHMGYHTLDCRHLLQCQAEAVWVSSYPAKVVVNGVTIARRLFSPNDFEELAEFEGYKKALPDVTDLWTRARIRRRVRGWSANKEKKLQKLGDEARVAAWEANLSGWQSKLDEWVDTHEADDADEEQMMATNWKTQVLEMRATIHEAKVIAARKQEDRIIFHALTSTMDNNVIWVVIQKAFQAIRGALPVLAKGASEASQLILNPKTFDEILESLTSTGDEQAPSITSAISTATELNKYGINIEGQAGIFPRFERRKFRRWRAVLFLPTIEKLGNDATTCWRNFLAFENTWSHYAGAWDEVDPWLQRVGHEEMEMGALHELNPWLQRHQEIRNLDELSNPQMQRKPFLSYLQFMDKLINTEDDVAILFTGSNPVILSSNLGDHKAVAELFNSITEGYYSGLYQKLYEPEWVKIQHEIRLFHNSKRRRLLVEFLDTNCGKPWIVMSIFVAFLILAAAVLQTCYTVISFYQ